jgi:hypothetical protein
MSISSLDSYLVDSITLNGGKDQFFDKLLTEVLLSAGQELRYLNVDGNSADFERLCLGSLEIFFLSYIRH